MSTTEGSICSSSFNSVITLVGTSDDITELKDNEHIEPSVIDKGSSYFNILECGRNLLDQLDVTYQRAFMSSPVQKVLYQPSSAQERYYDKMAESLIKAKFVNDGTINKTVNTKDRKSVVFTVSPKQ